MKIVVDRLPESPRDCPFSVHDVEYGYICQLRPYIDKAKAKPKCLCTSVMHCDLLIELEEAKTHD